MRQRSHTQELQAPTDSELTARAAAGDTSAFDELYRRHVDAAWRVAQAVTGNSHDAADAVSDAFTRVFQALADRLRDGDHFRPYLMASARNAAIDVLRRNGRLSPTDMSELDRPAVGNEPAELMMGEVDSSLVVRAFRSLPERWRSVLWLTEVEGIPPREAAGLLGMSPNGVAQLAVRARAGLRERFLQAHIAEGEVLAECRYSVDHLGAHVAGGLAPRDIAKVDQHLAGCATCRSRLAELEEISPALLRHAALPIPLGLAALVAAKWHLASVASQAGWAAGAGAATAATGAGAVVATAPAAVGLSGLVASASAPVAASVASVALFVASVVGVGVVAPGPSAPAPVPVVAGPLADSAVVSAAAGEATFVDDPLAGLVADADRVLPPLPTETEAPVAPTASDNPETVATAPADAVAPEAAGPLQLGLDLGLLDLVLGQGADGCTGIRIAGVTLGCEPAGEGEGVSAGGLLPALDVPLPLDTGLLDQLLAGLKVVAPSPTTATDSPTPKKPSLLGRLRALGASSTAGPTP